MRDYADIRKYQQPVSQKAGHLCFWSMPRWSFATAAIGASFKRFRESGYYRQVVKQLKQLHFLARWPTAM